MSAALILIVGPIAGGKSTLASEVAEALRRGGDAAVARPVGGTRDGGRNVALVALDQLADMARPTLPDWDDAHEIFAAVVGRWLGASGMDVVVAEGPGSVEEIDLVWHQIHEGTPVVTVVVTTSFEVGWERAVADRTRGMSRDPEFLRAAYERWAGQLPLITHDLLIDTGTTGLEEGVASILGALATVTARDVADKAPGAGVDADRPVHHIELWTHDLTEVTDAFDWLLGALGWETQHDPEWPTGRIWRHPGGTYIVLEQSPAVVGQIHDRMRPGLNHLALRLPPPGGVTLLDRLRADAGGHGWSELFADQYPHAGGAEHTALFLENPQGFEVEIVWD